MRFLASSMSLLEAVDGVGEHAGQHAVLRRDELLLACSVTMRSSMLADVLAQALDLLLHVDDRHVGDDAERGIEQVADLASRGPRASPSTSASG